MTTGEVITLTRAAVRLGITRVMLHKHVVGLGIKPQRVGPAKALTAQQYADVAKSVEEAAHRENNSIALEVAARRLCMARVTLGQRMKTLGIESRRVGQTKLLTLTDFARIEAYDQKNSRRRATRDTLKHDGKRSV